MGLLNLLTDPKNFKFYNGGQGYTGDGATPNLKNIPYGRDRLNGGSSNQPYIQTPIPDGTSTLSILNNDFIWRGGIGAPLNSAQDTERLYKMFTDTKTPNGLFFVTKQETLSRSAVRTQVSPNGVNGGIYSPVNTLTQAGVLFNGVHLPKQGINPFAGTGAYSNNDNLYGVKVQPNPNDPQGSKYSNRLVQLYTAVNNKLPFDLNGFILNNGVNVLSYSGGPGSKLGVGKTNIRYTDAIGRTGYNNYQADSPNYKAYFWGINNKIIEPGNYLITSATSGLSGKYRNLTGKELLSPYSSLNGSLKSGLYNFNVYDPTIEGNTWPTNTRLINEQGTYTYTQQDIIDTPITPGKLDFSPKIQDFRVVLKSKINQKELTKEKATQLGQLTDAPDYTAYNLEQRVRIGGKDGDGPGARSGKNYSNYETGVIYSDKTTGSLDRLNAFPVYQSDTVVLDSLENPVNDLVKFRIAIIDNNAPNQKQFIHFRAFLDSISDAYSATWNPVKYLGRGENFYTYDGFTRQISLSWTVAAQSKQELIPMYKKLNFLASSLTPDYSGLGYMRGNLAQLTIGGYIYEQPGIITGLTYTMEDNVPWEIGISVKPENGKLYDPTVKELAHIIKVTGFTFIPIHRFRPEIQSNENDWKQYIALANGFGDKVNEYESVPPADGLVKVVQNNKVQNNKALTNIKTSDTPSEVKTNDTSVGLGVLLPLKTNNNYILDEFYKPFGGYR
jgi:hypothetical protein